MKYIFVFASLLVSAYVYGQTTISSTAEVREVTVYTNGAALNNTVRATLPKGTSKLLINNVAKDIDVRSVQLGGPEGLTILSIAKSNDEEYEITDAVHKRLKDSLDASLAQREVLVNRQNAAQGALKILGNEQLFGGNDGKIDFGDLSKLVDYYQLKSVELNTILSKLKKDITEEDKKIAKLRERIRTYTGDGGQLVLQLTNSVSATAVLTLDYLTYQANWNAYYDLRAKSISSPLQILYKARITQYSGVDWRNVKLSLSTGNPSQSSNAPVLQPNYVSYRTDELYYQREGMAVQNKIQSIGSRAPMAEEAEMAASDMPDAQTPRTTLTENQLSTTFDIDVPYDIISNGQPHSVTLKNLEHPALFKYYAVPKLDRDAFLLAEIRDFEKLGLIPGEANLIFENMMVGQSYINPSVTTDTLNLSMGRDKSIQIKRERIMDEKSSQISGGTKRQIYQYEIRVRNAKTTVVNMVLKDQYPISTDKSIEVDLQDAGGAAVNMETGVLTWMISVKPGETQAFRFRFMVRHPKDKDVSF